MDLVATDKLVFERPLFHEEPAVSSASAFPKILKIAILAPLFACGFVFFLAVAILLTPLIPFVEIWRRTFVNR